MLIYKVTNNVNGKVYVGKTKYSLEKRRKNHLKFNHLNYFQLALRKYGAINFLWEVIENNIDDENVLNQKEIYYINFFKSNNKKFGYNLTNGGDGVRRKGWKHTEKTKRKIGKANKGQKRTVEQKINIQQAT